MEMKRITTPLSDGAIWVIGAKMYLDADVLFTKIKCLTLTCVPLAPVQMRLYLTYNL
jgi:hypothetical protein